MIEHILFPTDGTPGTEQIETRVIDLAQKYGARVTLLHVRESLVGNYENTFERLTELEEHLVSSATRMLKAAEGRLRDARVDVRCLLEKGKPSDVILHVAERDECDMIIMGSRQLTPLRKVLLGSVSHAVVNHSLIPVCIVPSHIEKT